MFKRIINTFGTRIVAALINFLIAVVLSQTLGDTGKGTQSLLLATISFILIFSEIICGESLVFLTPHYKIKQLFFPSVLWSALISVLMGLIIGCFYHGIGPLLIMHVAILAFINSLSGINTRILIGKEEIKKANYNTLLQPVVSIFILVIYYLVLHKTDIYGYIIALYFSYAASFMLGIWMLRRDYAGFFRTSEIPFFDASVMRDLFKYGFLNQTGHFVQFFNLRLSYYLLNAFMDEGRVGIFSNSVSLAESIWIISSSIALVQYARIANTSDRAYAQRLTLNLCKICLLVSAVAVIALSLLPASVYLFVFGSDFGEMAAVIRILAPGILCYCIFLILGHYYSGIGRYQMNTFASLCGLVVTFVMGFTLIPKYDITGAALTSVVSYSANAIFLLFFFFKESDFKWRDFLLKKEEVTEYITEIKKYITK